MKITLDIARNKDEDPFIRIPLKEQLFIGDIIYFSSDDRGEMDEYEYLIASLAQEDIEVEVKVYQRWYCVSTDTLMIDAR